MAVFAVIWRELNAAAVQDRPVLCARVTIDAIPGSPVVLPLTPERERLVISKWYAFPDGTVDAVYEGRALELLLHPQDWYDVCLEVDDAFTPSLAPGKPDRIFGLPVVV